jgi:hypothetical protein
MSSFEVTPAAVADAGARLRSISPAILDAAGRVGAHGAAGAGTPAESALADLTTRWAAVLPHFALSGDALASAVATAAVAYTGVDEVIADGAAIAGGREPAQ